MRHSKIPDRSLKVKLLGWTPKDGDLVYVESGQRTTKDGRHAIGWAGVAGKTAVSSVAIFRHDRKDYTMVPLDRTYPREHGVHSDHAARINRRDYLRRDYKRGTKPQRKR